MAKARWRVRLYKTDRARDFAHERDRVVRAQQICETIDRQPFQWIVVLVAGVGFFTDGYTLFASNSVLPMLAYVYWTNETSSLRETYINVATLAGSMIGQVVFGIAADRIGRRKMYGLELMVLIGATLGVVMCSTGAHNSMSVFAWLIWWRIIVGIGVGADYPLSAVITSEFAPTKSRGRMMAAVFAMQPLGQIVANAVSIFVVLGVRDRDETDTVRAVDQMWRWVIGAGVLPAFIALLFRLTIPESPRYTVDVAEDPGKAEFDAAKLFTDPAVSDEIEMESQGWKQQDSGGAPASISSFPSADNALTTVSDFSGPTAAWPGGDQTYEAPDHFSKEALRRYFWDLGNWRTLAGTSLAWLFLDFAFYGLGLSNAQLLAKVWGAQPVTADSPVWDTQVITGPGAIYKMFIDDSLHVLVILSIGTFVGSALFIALVPHINRVSLQKWGFLVLAVFFIATGVVFVKVENSGPALIVLYCVCQVAFNLGPNATTFILPAEVFPTQYRCTGHGISAASGKLGAVLVQIFTAYVKFGTHSSSLSSTQKFGYILCVMSGFMVAGAVVTHIWIPNVQGPGTKSKTLEALSAERRASSGGKNMTAGFTRQWRRWWRR